VTNFRKIVLGLAALILVTILALIFYYLHIKEEPAAWPVSSNTASSPKKETVQRFPFRGHKSPLATQDGAASVSSTPTSELTEERAASPTGETPPATIDPARLERAKAEYMRNQKYETEARATLPILSLQTHNPIWALEYQVGARAGNRGALQTSGAKSLQGPLPAPTAGEFGQIQPQEGEIWLRIPAAYAAEHRDIMAQNADLYRAITGYKDPLVVTLWVGGRPYARFKYE